MDLSESIGGIEDENRKRGRGVTRRGGNVGWSRAERVARGFVDDYTAYVGKQRHESRPMEMHNVSISSPHCEASEKGHAGGRGEGGNGMMVIARHLRDGIPRTHKRSRDAASILTPSPSPFPPDALTGGRNARRAANRHHDFEDIRTQLT